MGPASRTEVGRKYCHAVRSARLLPCPRGGCTEQYVISPSLLNSPIGLKALLAHAVFAGVGYLSTKLLSAGYPSIIGRKTV